MQAKTILVNGQRAVPIPDPLLKGCPIGDDVDVSATSEGLLIKPIARTSRAGWAEALQKVPAATFDEDYQNLRAVRETADSFDRQEWDW